MDLKKFSVYLIGAFFVLPMFASFFNTSNKQTNPITGQVVASYELLAGNPLIDQVSIGPKNASIIVFEFSDYECPYCGASAGINEEGINLFKSKDSSWIPAVPTLKTLADQGSIRYVFKQFPLDSHAFSFQASLASLCAAEQEKFFEYHDALFENNEALGELSLKKYATDLGLNTTQFNECLDTKKYQYVVYNEITQGQRLGITGTPSYYVNNQLLQGAVSGRVFEQII